jgi:uncharacterized protein (TIRG00374 family)
MKFALRVLLSLAVSAVFVAFSLRNTNADAVLTAIASADKWTLTAYMATLLGIHLVRVVRWQFLLVPLGRVSFARVNRAVAVGFMLLVLLPLRLGEFARPVLISDPPPEGGVRVPRTGALGSCVVERLIDTLAVGILAIVSLHVLATTGYAAEYARHAATVVTGGFGALCVVLAFAFVMRERAVALLHRIVGRASVNLADRLAGMLDRFINGLHVGSAGRLLGVLGLTVIHWSFHVLGFWILAPAFDLHLTVLMAATVLASQVVGSMIPAGPGMIGTMQFFIQLGLSIFIPGALTQPDVVARAAAYANTIWIMQFAQQVLFGLPYVIGGHVMLGRLVKRLDGVEPATPEA